MPNKKKTNMIQQEYEAALEVVANGDSNLQREG
jgi:hypothetical protein